MDGHKQIVDNENYFQNRCGENYEEIKKIKELEK